ncbi:MAG TPA: hypothetical protein VK801_11575 [Caulobacteraceae bacterium]|nr:hypothetical protein [Caulobacteraceae bacterium]
MPDDTPALADAPDPEVLGAEWRMRLLEEMAELCMDLARIVHRQAKAAAELAEPSASEADEVPANRAAPASPSALDPSDAIARISRALRLTLALHARTEEQLRALRAGVVAECEARRALANHRAAADASLRRQRRRDTVLNLVTEAAEREVEDEEALWDVIEAVEERLNEDEAYQNLEAAPLRELVERLCADLELNPDWSLWEGEGWTPDSPFSRSRFSPWGRPSRRPLGVRDTNSHPAGLPAPCERALE